MTFTGVGTGWNIDSADFKHSATKTTYENPATGDHGGSCSANGKMVMTLDVVPSSGTLTEAAVLAASVLPLAGSDLVVATTTEPGTPALAKYIGTWEITEVGKAWKKGDVQHFSVTAERYVDMAGAAITTTVVTAS